MVLTITEGFSGLPGNIRNFFALFDRLDKIKAYVSAFVKRDGEVFRGFGESHVFGM